MAGPAPKTQLWTARENVHKPEGLHIIVGGQVEVSDADKAPVLTEASGGGPQVLVLDLTIANTSEPAIGAKVWKQAYYHKEVAANQFERVQIRWDGKQIAITPVIDDREHSQLLDKQTKLQNAAAAKNPNLLKKVSSKVAGKAKSAKKSAKKVAKKAAKTAKKAAKKVTKKAAKKAPKKSALKRFVKKLVRKLTPKKAAKKAPKKAKKAKGKKRR